MMSRMVFTLSLAIPLTLPPGHAHAQINKCTDSSGNITFSDRACAASEDAEKVRINVQPVDEEAARALASEREREIQQRQSERRRAQSLESSRRIAEADRKIAELKAENYDAQKCSEARTKMAIIKANDPVMYKGNLSYFEYYKAAELYCGD